MKSTTSAQVSTYRQLICTLELQSKRPHQPIVWPIKDHVMVSNVIFQSIDFRSPVLLSCYICSSAPLLLCCYSAATLLLLYCYSAATLLLLCYWSTISDDVPSLDDSRNRPSIFLLLTIRKSAVGYSSCFVDSVLLGEGKVAGEESRSQRNQKQRRRIPSEANLWGSPAIVCWRHRWVLSRLRFASSILQNPENHSISSILYPTDVDSNSFVSSNLTQQLISIRKPSINNEIGVGRCSGRN